MNAPTVADRLVAFMRQWQTGGVPADVLHEANRLLLNQLKASIGATQDTAVQVLHRWAVGGSRPAQASILWLGTRTSAECAAVVNGALCEVLDFNDTYIPCFMHAVSGVLPAALASAERQHSSGAELLTALAIGIEVELACATLLMPSGYYRGFVPGGITGAVGGAAACAILSKLSDDTCRNALGLAMNSGFGTYQSAGFMTLPYIMGMVGRAGLNCCELAALGLDAPPAAFEGDKAMLSAYSSESPDRIATVLDSLGREPRIFGQSYKTVPTETITHAPLECLLQIRQRSRGRGIARMRFGVAAVVAKIADERMQRFGAPSSELTAKFDLRHCAAAAWRRGRFTLEEMREAAYRDPDILALRSRIELVADATFETFEGAALTVEFDDGSTESARVDQFRGTPGNPLTDADLSSLFSEAAGGLVSPAHAQAILELTWGLPQMKDVTRLVSQLKLDQDPADVTGGGAHAAR